jgi:hypothetical protein
MREKPRLSKMGPVSSIITIKWAIRSEIPGDQHCVDPYSEWEK